MFTRCPALKTALLFMLGILAAYLLPFSFSSPGLFLVTLLFLLTTGGLLWANLFPDSTRQLLVPVTVFLTGFSSYQLDRQLAPVDHYRYHLTTLGTPHPLCAVVASTPEHRGEKLRFQASLKSALVDGQARPFNGTLLVSTAFGSTPVVFGDQVVFNAAINPPPGPRFPGDFDYGAYLARQHISGLAVIEPPGLLTVIGQKQGPLFFQYVVVPFRTWLLNLVDRTVPPAAAPLLKGVLFGLRSDLDPDLMQQFLTCGILHIIAVSGLNVALVATVFLTLFRWLRLARPASIAGTMVMLVVYMFITELAPSVVRATIMALVLLAGQVLERDGVIYNTLAVAALFILFIWPQSLFDVGFQLSFVATLAIVYGYPRLIAALPPVWQKQNTWWKKWLIGGAAVSLAAQLGTSPLTMYYFNNLSLISLAANLAVVPMVLGATYLGFALCIVGAVPPLGWALGQLIALLVWCTEKVSGVLAAVPYASLDVASPSPLVLCLTFAACWLLLDVFRSAVARKALVMTGLLYCAAAVWTGAGSPREMTITFLSTDRSRGAAIVELPDHQTLLFKTAEQNQTNNFAQRTITSFLKHNGQVPIDTIDLSLVRGPGPQCIRRDEIVVTLLPLTSARSDTADTAVPGPIAVVSFGRRNVVVAAPSALARYDGLPQVITPDVVFCTSASGLNTRARNAIEALGPQHIIIPARRGRLSARSGRSSTDTTPDWLSLADDGIIQVRTDGNRLTVKKLTP
jgi:ComEC/Rec2-related protein